MPKPIGNSSRYMPGLDGLRAIAVLAVIAYHLNLQWVPGGLLGVTMFFVLSGYLITDILLKQLSQSKTLDLKTFFIRRARRLLPAMFLMIAVVSLWLLISDTGRLLSLKGDIGSALLYISNWYLIFHDVSYFESFGPASPFGHLWSLAVEEQFYLIWPLVLLAVIRFSPKRGKLALWTLAAAAVSAGAMTLLYQPGADPSRVYYGTDTRAFALLIGAALAIVWPSWKLSATLSKRSRIVMDAVGTFGFVIILVMINQSSEYDSFLYRGGMVLLSLATAVVVAALAHPASKLANIIGSKALAWVGVRSYGIYLYHYPIIVLTTPTAESGELHLARALIQVILTFALAELSWRFIEEPIRHGALGKIYSLFKRQTIQRIRVLGLKKASTYLAVLVIVFSSVSCTSSVNLQSASGNGKNNETSVVTPVKPNDSGETTPDTEREPDKTGQNETVSNPKPTEPEKQTPPQATEPPDQSKTPAGSRPDQTDPSVIDPKLPSTGTATDVDKSKPVPTDTDKPTSNNPQGSKDNEPVPGKKPVAPIDQNSVTAIGDSVLLDAGPFLEKLVPGIVIDGKIGRQFGQASAVIEDLKKNNQLGNTVVIQLGTNGAFTTKQMNGLLSALGTERQIIFINTRVPRKWQDSVNKMLAATAKKSANVTIVDWYTASKGKKDFFAADGVHLKKHGAEFYADLLVEAIDI
ncbi:acyltransferase family protein [Bacillus sp. FJAT-28004]|uniref:acyltransferase family protein n=1 Tax=Bacillus sp. FJAT-28004 TaxID=1679165 RepID=UPI0006B66B3D|nr:acyltransferase family protein [Bacillus sp. FJAT-28004]